MRVDRLSSLGGVALLLVACGEAGVPDASNLTTPSLAPSGHMTPYSGPFAPSAIATDDGRVIIIAGAGRTDDDRAVGVLARSDDGASTFSLWQVEGAEAFDGVAIRGRTIWITADCVSSACLLGSTDDGLTFHDLGTGRSLSPSLSSPTAGIVLSPLVDGEAQALEVDGAGTFTPIDICGADASPVSVSVPTAGAPGQGSIRTRSPCPWAPGPTANRSPPEARCSATGASRAATGGFCDREPAGQPGPSHSTDRESRRPVAGTGLEGELRWQDVLDALGGPDVKHGPGWMEEGCLRD